MAKSVFLSIIICTYNRASYLQDTLESLFDTDADHENFEIIIVDNNSTDRTKEITRAAAQNNPQFDIRYCSETRQGLSHARNRGVAEASAPVLLFLDDDISAPAPFIASWISFFKNHPRASGGGGKIQVQFDAPRPPWMSHFLLPLLGHHNFGNHIKKYPTNKYPFGGNMAFRKEVFEQYGNFNTDLGRKGSNLTASEEKEFFQRLPDSQLIYYLPDAFIHHRVDKKRLTKSYIKKQAVGLGTSIAIQQKEASIVCVFQQGAAEFLKFIATIFLGFGYGLLLRFSTAGMLLKFRWWIWKGYLEARSA
jgi:glycosyltransferase involved in cell wall biosynthesis